MTKMLGLVLAMLLALGLGGCGDDSGDGEGGGGSSSGEGGSGTPTGGGGSGSGTGAGAGSGSAGSGSGPGDAAMCLMASSGTTDPSCDTSEYGQCVADACKEEIADCLGPDWESGDFEGSVCESLCTGGTTIPPQECLSCLVGLTACSSSCQLPECALQGGGTGGSGGVPMSDKTCADLEACCNALDAGSAKDVCNQVLAGSMAAGDIACAAAYTNTLFACAP